MLTRNRKTRKSVYRNIINLLNKKCIYRLQLAGLIFVCTLFGGCAPIGFAAGAFLIKYLNEQARIPNSTTYSARQQEPIRITQQPQTAQTVIPQSEDRKTIEKANKAYRNLEWNESSHLLKEAIGRGELSRSDQSQAYILLGAMAYQQGQVREAESCFKKSSEIDGSAIPSAELYPPLLIEFYKSVNRNI